MKFLTGLGKIFDHINIVMIILSAVFLLGMTFIVGADITLRYLFLRPLGWVKEVSEYILVVLGFLVAAWILKDDGHVKMDLVISKVSPKTQTLLNIITSTISTFVVLIIALFSARVIVQFHQTKLVAPTVLEPQKWILLTPIFLGSLLLAIQFMRRTFNLIHRWKVLGRQKGEESPGPIE